MSVEIQKFRDFGDISPFLLYVIESRHTSTLFQAIRTIFHEPGSELFRAKTAINRAIPSHFFMVTEVENQHIVKYSSQLHIPLHIHSWLAHLYARFEPRLFNLLCSHFTWMQFIFCSTYAYKV